MVGLAAVARCRSGKSTAFCADGDEFAHIAFFFTAHHAGLPKITFLWHSGTALSMAFQRAAFFPDDDLFLSGLFIRSLEDSFLLAQVHLDSCVSEKSRKLYRIRLGWQYSRLPPSIVNCRSGGTGNSILVVERNAPLTWSKQRSGRIRSFNRHCRQNFHMLRMSRPSGCL